MQRTGREPRQLSLPDLPVVTGRTLAPQLCGPEKYWRVLCQVLEALPNRKALMEKRLSERRPVPVRFEWRD